MARRADMINAFTRGELDPELRERVDLQHYYLAVEKARNQIALLQGGLARAPGTVATGKRLRRRIEPIQIDADMITAANGGTKANLVDQDVSTTFTTNGVSGDPFVVCEVDLGSDVAVCFVDVVGFESEDTARDDCFGVEYYDGANWQPFGVPDGAVGGYLKNLRTAARTRRFACKPGGETSARHYRIVVTGGSGPGDISIDSLRMWRERDDLSPVELISFAKSNQEVYEIALSDRNIDIFRDGAYLGSAIVPLAAELVPEAAWVQSLDTLFLFHQEMRTWRVLRQAADDEWNADAPDFTNVPDLSASTAFSGDQDEIQDLTFTGLASGDKVVLYLGDLITGEITYSDDATLATDIATEIEALPGVDSDNIAASVEDAGVIRVAFRDTNGAQAWPLLAGVALEPSSATIAAAVVQRGLNASGSLMADDTGWPSCGTLYQGRLMLGGFRGAPSTYGFSRAGDLFDFTDSGDPVTADMGLINTIDSDQVETIKRLAVGQNLHLFTGLGEWWIENRTIDATQPLNVLLAHRYGIEARLQPMPVQGAMVFVQDGGEINGARQPAKVVRDMIFDFAERNNYTAEPLSLLGPHLLTDIVAMAHRPGVTTREASLVAFVNADGKMALLTLMRAQEVIAMTPRDTPGKFRGAATDINRNLWLAVEREVDGRDDIWLERMDDDAILDAQVTLSGTASVTVDGLEHLEGREDVWVFADGDRVGPFTVTGGEITLDDPASERIAGLFAGLEGRTMPMREKAQDGNPLRPPLRVYEVEFALAECGDFEMRANGGDWVEVPIRHLNGAPIPKEATGEEPEGDLDTPLLDRLYTGYMRIENLKGITRQGQIEWRQTKPAPFKMRALRYKVAS
jgi:hypothetical protein